MKSSNGTKRVLISAMVSLVLCMVMLIGTTMAWFTDTIQVSADINVGEMKVALEKYVFDDAGNGAYKNIGTKENNVGYTETTEPVFTGANWTPNYTQVYYLAVRNEGSIEFNYDMELTLSGALVGALEYAIINGVEAGTDAATSLNQSAAAKDWDAIKASASGQTGSLTAGPLTAAPNGHLEAGEVEYFALVLHMKKDADNRYQKTKFEADIVVNARQTTYVEP
ncbi:MAG: hypothetical protein IKK59_03465 [Lachnospiraceae bacterium]|nr:hypothetical protein [Lachnospiraceae bacterium]